MRELACEALFFGKNQLHAWRSVIAMRFQFNVMIFFPSSCLRRKVECMHPMPKMFHLPPKDLFLFHLLNTKYSSVQVNKRPKQVYVVLSRSQEQRRDYQNFPTSSRHNQMSTRADVNHLPQEKYVSSNLKHIHVSTSLPLQVNSVCSLSRLISPCFPASVSTPHSSPSCVRRPR